MENQFEFATNFFLMTDLKVLVDVEQLQGPIVGHWMHHIAKNVDYFIL